MNDLKATQLKLVIQFYDIYKDTNTDNIGHALRDMLSNSGLPPLEDGEMQEVMEVAGLESWENLEIQQIADFFTALLDRQNVKDMGSTESSGLMEAFMALGGSSDKSGQVNAQQLEALCTKFDLRVDEEVLQSCTNGYDDFVRLFQLTDADLDGDFGYYGNPAVTVERSRSIQSEATAMEQRLQQVERAQQRRTTMMNQQLGLDLGSSSNPSPRSSGSKRGSMNPSPHPSVHPPERISRSGSLIPTGRGLLDLGLVMPPLVLRGGKPPMPLAQALSLYAHSNATHSGSQGHGAGAVAAQRRRSAERQMARKLGLSELKNTLSPEAPLTPSPKKDNGIPAPPAIALVKPSTAPVPAKPSDDDARVRPSTTPRPMTQSTALEGPGPGRSSGGRVQRKAPPKLFPPVALRFDPTPPRASKLAETPGRPSPWGSKQGSKQATPRTTPRKSPRPTPSPKAPVAPITDVRHWRVPVFGIVRQCEPKVAANISAPPRYSKSGALAGSRAPGPPPPGADGLPLNPSPSSGLYSPLPPPDPPGHPSTLQYIREQIAVQHGELQELQAALQASAGDAALQRCLYDKMQLIQSEANVIHQHLQVYEGVC